MIIKSSFYSRIEFLHFPNAILSFPFFIVWTSFIAHINLFSRPTGDFRMDHCVVYLKPAEIMDQASDRIRYSPVTNTRIVLLHKYSYYLESEVLSSCNSGDPSGSRISETNLLFQIRICFAYVGDL
jgi:hypothetical protein